MENLDLRIQKTYRALITAFNNLLASKDFEEISVTELCQTAMIRRPTFYKHFIDKYDFLSFYIKYEMNQLFDLATTRMNGPGENFFIQVFQLLLQQDDTLLNLIFTIQTNANIMSELVDLQEFGQEMLLKQVKLEADSDEQNLKKNYQAQLIMGLTIQSVYWYKSNQEWLDEEKMIDLYAETINRLSLNGKE